MRTQYQFLLQHRAGGGIIGKRDFDAEASVEAEDVTLRMPVTIRAREVSPYRHALLLNGCSYNILGVIRQ